MNEMVYAQRPARLAAGVELTIVLPTFNERANAASMVARLDRVLKDVAWEVIFVDDDSPDGTAEAVRALGAEDARVRCIRRVRRRGRASACIEGMLAAQGTYVAVMDADLQHDERVLPDMLRLLRENRSDLAIGTRYGEGGSSEGLAGIRQTISRSAGALARLMLRMNISDPTSGFFATRREIIDAAAPRLATEGFNTLLDIASLPGLDLRISEVPYTFRARVHGESKLGAHVALDFAALLVSRLAFNVLPQRFLLFSIVGISGVAVHFLALLALIHAGVDFTIAQLTAALISMASNFWLNNVLTYRDQTLHGLAAFKGLALYALICSVGFFSNIGVAQWIYAANSTWWLAGVMGAVVSAVWNYAVSATLVWRKN
jgi:dolichol-phosphate mannosyltransferase